MSYSFPTNQPDGTEVTLANGVTYRFDATNDRWLVKSVHDDGVSVGDLFWEEVDTGSNQNPPLTLMITHPTRPTGGGTEGLLHLWHGDPAQTTTSPEQEFKVWMRDGGQAIQDKYDEDGFAPEFEIRQGDKRLRFKSQNGGWTTNNQTYHASGHETEGDVLTDGPCELFIKYEDNSFVALLDERYVNKFGGDEMQGPFVIKNNPDNGNSSRENRRLTVLDIKSGTDQSSLNLGALNTSVYVGANQTTFAKPIHVNDVKEKDDGKGVTFASTIRFDSVLDTVVAINPEVGGEQEISLFGNGQDKIVKVDIQGATYKNAIEFISGPSADRDAIFRIDSNKGIKVKDLKAWDTTIGDVADPQISKDAVNLRTAEKMIGDLEQRIRDKLDNLINENAAGEMKWAIVQFPQAQGTFTTWSGLNGSGSTEPDVTKVRTIQAHNTNLSGYPFGWDQLKPGQYIYMTGPMEILARFRITSEPENKGDYTQFNVADGFTSPEGISFFADDEYSVMFREFSGGSADLDEYLPIDGSKPMTGELEAYHKVMAKIPVAADSSNQEFETAVLMAEGWRSGTGASGARITLSNKYNNNAYATIDYYGTTEASGNVQFARAKYEFKRFGNSRDGFTIRGRADNGGSVGNNAKLLSVYHNNGSGTNYDAVNYFGKMDSADNLATVGYVGKLFGEESVVTPYGELTAIANGRVPAAGEISFGSTKPSETASIALSKTDKDGNTNDYHYGVDSIFSVVVESTIVSGDDEYPMKQLVSVRVDGIEDKGGYIILTVDGRDVHCKQRDENTGQYFYAMDPRFWYYGTTDTITPMQKVPASLDEMFQFRDETAVFPEYFKFKLSTASGDGIGGANTGYLYMQDSLTNPSWIRLCLYDRYGYGFLGKTDKSTATMTVNCPGEMTMFARSKWTKSLIPVQGWKFDALYFNQNKESVRLNNKAETWKNAYHDWSDGEEVLVKFDFSRGTSTRALEQELDEMKARLAKLEGGK